MTVTVAIDSFKGSLSSVEASDAAKAGIQRVYPDAKVLVCPLADGGEGTLDAIMGAVGGELVTVPVSSPLGERIEANYGVTEDGYTVIEMAAAAGLTLVPNDKRDPSLTTTYGVGELIRHAIERGSRKFIVALGGSATNDGGAGMLSALGFELLKRNGEPIPLGCAGLEELFEIRTDNVPSELYECEFTVASDVTNPLCGDMGASRVFASQKGADEEMIEKMDKALRHFAELTARLFGKDLSEDEGAGAAGGMGFAFISYLGAKIESGARLVIKICALEEKIKLSDVVLTGEGRLDGQSVMGKAPIGVASVAKKYGKPTVAVAGCVTEDAGLSNDSGIDAFFPILKAPTSLEDAMNVENAYKNLADTAEQIFRLIRAFTNNK